ncbi:MAG: pyridoxamine kinase [Oscillospiraceae bacterium]|nr:pyridoxamine kinase [Oscillospiraceae bacterium]
MKRIVSIQDFSCIGKCSQSIALPVLSAMGLECAALPTVLLSAHTAFDGFVSRALTDSIAPITEHWKRLGVRFDAIYTGYLGSAAQIAQVERIIADFGTDENLIFVDPVMADHGRLYAGFAPDFPESMKTLCRHADVITPNVTEACLLTGETYRERHEETFVRALLEKLLALGAKTAIVTGIRTDDAQMGVAVMDEAGKLSLHNTEYVPSVFYGTGDLFAATCAGALTLGLPAERAIALAADYVVQTIRVTAQDPDARWYGVNFEQTLPYLMKRLGEEQK